MKLTLTTVKQMLRRITSPRSTQDLDLDAIKEMARGIATTHPDELGCAGCFEQMDRFVEETLAGKNAGEAMPLVQDHLARCRDCREEFEALLAALQAIT